MHALCRSNVIILAEQLNYVLPCPPPPSPLSNLSIVEAYNNLFGHLSVVSRNGGKSLFVVLKSIPEVKVTGDKPFNQVVALSEQKPQPPLRISTQKEKEDSSSSGNEVQYYTHVVCFDWG